MRGSDGRSGGLFSYVRLEARVPERHPLRTIREIANAALAGLGAEIEIWFNDNAQAAAIAMKPADEQPVS